MAVSEEDLDYEHYLSHFDPSFRKNKKLLQEIMHTYTQRVIEGMQDLYVSIPSVSANVVNSQAKFHLQCGVGLRMKFLWLSLSSLLDLAPPKRREPLSTDDRDEVSLNLNTIYINIRGTLDNFAWCLLEIFRENSQLSPRHIDLFGKKFLEELPTTSGIIECVDDFLEWNKELKTRRDPAAHRIPLFVPPAIHDDTSLEEFSEINAEYSQTFDSAIGNLGRKTNASAELHEVNRLAEDLQRVGTFEPEFLNWPPKKQPKLDSVYPIVPQDAANLVRISRGLISIIQKGVQNL